MPNNLFHTAEPIPFRWSACRIRSIPRDCRAAKRLRWRWRTIRSHASLDFGDEGIGEVALHARRERFEFAEPHMGTEVRIVLYASTAAAQEKELVVGMQCDRTGANPMRVAAQLRDQVKVVAHRHLGVVAGVDDALRAQGLRATSQLKRFFDVSADLGGRSRLLNGRERPGFAGASRPGPPARGWGRHPEVNRGAAGYETAPRLPATDRPVDGLHRIILLSGATPIVRAEGRCALRARGQWG